MPIPMPIRTSIPTLPRVPGTPHRTLWHWHSPSSSRQPRTHITWMRINRAQQQRPQHPREDQCQNQNKNRDQDLDQDHRGPWTWGTGLKPGFGVGFGSMEWFEREQRRTRRRMEVIKREIERDPYGVLFGKGASFGSGWGQMGQSGVGMGMGQLWRDLFGDATGQSERPVKQTEKTEQTGKKVDQATAGQSGQKTEHIQTTARQVKAEQTGQTEQTAARANLEFDPIAGRMVPRDRGDFDPVTGRMTPKGYLSPIEREDPASPEQMPETKSVLEKARQDSWDTGQAEEAPEQVLETKSVPEKAEAGKAETGQAEAGQLLETGQTGKAETEKAETGKAETGKAETGQARWEDSWNTAKAGKKLKIQDSTKQAEPILLPEDQELDLLRASDIRASYPARQTTQTTQTTQSRQLDSIAQQVSKLAEETALLESGVQEAVLAKQDAQTQGEVFPAPEPHRQPEQQPEQTYCVLAYDPSTQQVTRATTVSSLTSETGHAKDILPRLNHPAKFLAHFEQMQKDGYEIVSGGGDILVFRAGQVIQGSGQCDAGIMDPQDYLASLPENTGAGAGADAGAAGQTPKRGWRVMDTVRRMAFAGTATAATCYAIGVVTEYFRTGGQDGRGMDGFTAFESERKALSMHKE